MPFDPYRHRRRSTRLAGHDYAQSGAYFVTIVAQDRACMFGEIVDGKMVLSDVGRMIDAAWREMPDHYAGVALDVYAVMPNHVHGIVVLTRPADTVGASPCARPVGHLSLPDVVHRLKSLTTARYRRGVDEHGWIPFRGKVWHRNYHDHVIRSDAELARLREYITDNPRQWHEDPERPGDA